MNDTLPLDDMSIVVTRPRHQNNELLSQLKSLGATPIAFPCIEIRPYKSLSISSLQEQIKHSQIVIFTSSNAVRQFFKLLPDLQKLIPTDCLIYAVGAATAESLSHYSVNNVIFPSTGFDSEQLLNTPALNNIEQKMISIIKGVGGRELLYDTLIQRGAEVVNIEIYQRHCPQKVDITALKNKIDLILFTSSETVSNFLTLTSESLQTSLLNSQTVVGHARIAEKVSTLGFKKMPIIAATPADVDMLEAILQWAKQK